MSYIFMCLHLSTPYYYFQVLMKLHLTLKKYPNIKFNENIFSGSRIDSCGWTDTQTGR